MKQRQGLANLHPTIRFIVFIVLSTLFTLAYSWPAVLASVTAGILLLIVGRKYPRAALIACASAGFLTFIGNALFARENLIFSFLIFHASQESLLNGLRLGLRISAMILPAIAFIAVTPLHEFLVAFRGLHIPVVAEMYLTIVLRYVDILWYEIQISMKAMAMRGVNWEGNVKQRVMAFRNLMLPLIFRIFEHVEGQSLAIDNRGGITAIRQHVEIDSNKPALVFRNVYVRYDSSEPEEDEHAVTNINLTIENGSTTVLLGRTGSGKTTTMLLSTGLIPHSVGRMKGQVELFGYNTLNAPLSHLGRISRIVLTSAVQGLVGLTVRDELTISLRVSQITCDEYPPAMEQALNMAGLNISFLDRLTLGLSGGEMQRVALASAIVARPQLLVLDDVTMQLDPRGKREVISALRTLTDKKITKLICDSHVSLLEETGERFINLENGRVTADKSTLDIQAVQKAGLRIPQMWQLGELLGRNLPQQARDAIPYLRDLAQGARPEFAADRDVKGEVIVSAHQLTYAYPNGPTVLKGVDLEFRQGEFVAILGSNGSGKTTSALLLAGAMTPTAGQIYVKGEPFKRGIHRGFIGYVFQEPRNQMVTMKVFDELAFGPQQLGWHTEQVESAVEREIKRFNLQPDAIPLHLQPAEARKVSIAATLAMNPQMVILDEPTNNLDADDVDQLMGHLKQLQSTGKTIVLISHDIDVALRYADRLIVMSGGNVLADGPTRKIAAQPELLAQSDVIVPAVVDVSMALWPNCLPSLTVEELAECLHMPGGSGKG